MINLGQFVFGAVDFRANEEHQSFRFKFLCVVLLSGAVFTLVFLLGILTGVNAFSGQHVRTMGAFTALAVLLWLLLRGHQERYDYVAWVYEVACLIEYTSALVFVPSDEMRVLWFATNIPGVYILLGQRAGLIITVLTIVGLALGNSYLSRPYSQNGLATTLVGFSYLAIFFHVFGNQSMSYFLRMAESNRKLQHIAAHDPLTGVLNAAAYYATCDQMIQLAKRNGTPYAVLFIDLDHFKSINDEHGHAAGDHVLKSVAQTLQERIRHSDAVGRVGGEEFSVFLPNTDTQGALSLAETIRQAIEQLTPQIGATRLVVTASIGVARNQHSAQSMLEIQHRADQAMYLAKASGRNRVSAVETA